MRLPLATLRPALAAVALSLSLQFAPPSIAAPLVDCGAGAPCSRADFGSCGNACCAMTFTVKSRDSEATVAAISKALRKGGPDGQYSLPPLDGGRAGFNDIRKFGVPADFIGQAVHTTAKAGYRDTINIAVKDDKVRACSIAQIGGAFGDAGQNFRNLEVLFKAVDGASDGEVEYGCGSGSSQPFR